MHPQGGGQPSDKGILKTGDSEFHVEKVENRGDKVWHIGYFQGDERKGFRVGVHVKSKIDGERRAHNARNHSAGHLLDEALQNLGMKHLKQIKGYYYPNRPYVEFLGKIEETDRPKVIKDLTEEMNRIIWNTSEEDLMEVQIRNHLFKGSSSTSSSDSEEEGAVQDLNPNQVEENAMERTRFVKLRKNDPGCPCGGTHVNHVNEIGKVDVTKIEQRDDIVRIYYKVLEIEPLLAENQEYHAPDLSDVPL